MAKKKNNKFTIMFIPDDNGRTVSLHLHKRIVQSLVLFMLFFVVGICCLLYVAGDIAVKLQLVYSLKNDNERLRTENHKLIQISETVNKIQDMNRYFKRLATATGNSIAAPAQSALAATREKEAIFNKDNLDNFVDDVRLYKSESGAPQKDSAFLPKQFIDAIPYIRPVEGWITKGFVSDTADSFHVHPGIDFAAASGALIRATAPGIVTDITTDTYLGKLVVIQHKFGFITKYGHCSQVLVSRGDHVERGQTIALVGSSGRSSAPHLHYEVLKEGKQIDPLRYLVNQQG